MRLFSGRFVLLFGAFPLVGCAATPPAKSPLAPEHIEAEPRYVSADAVATESEMLRSAELALSSQHWPDAVRLYGTLLNAAPEGPHAPEYMWKIGLAYEGMGERTFARETFLKLAEKFPLSGLVRGALVRTATLDAYLEKWGDLSAIGTKLLERTDLDDVDRTVALGARGLAAIEQGDDMAASKDIHEGLDLADRIHYGAADVLPVAAAQLRFALGELRRVRAERVKFDPVPPDFLAKLEERCSGVLEAQASYAQAVRSVDPHWATMAGYRVGEMYRLLHQDLVGIPTPKVSKTKEQKEMFFALMHLRYRTLLEKGLHQIDETIALGERIGDSSMWMKRAVAAKSEIQVALDDEKATIAKMPFTEAQVQKALDEVERRAAAAEVSKGTAH